MREGDLHFQDWFDALDYETLGEKKAEFFAKMKPFEVSPSFKDFHDWLLDLQEFFGYRFLTKVQQVLQQSTRRRLLLEQSGDKVQPAAFDEETLGGYVTYSAFIHPVRHLAGELEGLVIRYDPSPSPLPILTGESQAGA